MFDWALKINYLSIYLDYTRISYPQTSKDVHNVFFSTVKVKLNNKYIINFMSIYLPKRSDNTNTEWLRDITLQSNSLGEISKHICGHICGQICPITSNNRFIENIVDSSLVHLNGGSMPRIPDVENHRSTAIDLSLESPQRFPDCSWETFEGRLGSDHFPIVIKLSDSRSVHEATDDRTHRFNYDRADWVMFNDGSCSMIFWWLMTEAH